MTYVNRSELCSKFLTYHKRYNKFNDLSQEDLDRIESDVKNLRSELKGYERYIRTMLYYTHPLRQNFDETVADLIIACDPFLEALEIYEQLGSPNKENKAAMEEYANQVRNTIGFYDANLRIFEKAYKSRLKRLDVQKAFEEVQGKKKALKNSEK